MSVPNTFKASDQLLNIVNKATTYTHTYISKYISTSGDSGGEERMERQTYLFIHHQVPMPHIKNTYVSTCHH